MFKALGRAFQKAQDFLIIVKVKTISCDVDEDCMIKVVWQRGPSTEHGTKVDISTTETKVLAFDEFKKISSFYSKDGNFLYEPKMCIFKLIILDSNEEEREIAIQEVNMAPYVDREAKEETIYFDQSEFPNTSIEVEWTITSDTSSADASTRMSIVGGSVVGSALEGLEIGNMSIQEFIQKAYRLEEET